MNWTWSKLLSMSWLQGIDYRLSALADYVAAIVVAATLGGCSSVHLYDAPRAETAKLAVEQRKNAKLDEVSEDTAQLLDALLEREIDAAAAANEFLFDNDMFRIAASRDGEELLTDWVQQADERLKALGFESRAQVREAADAVEDVRGAQEEFDLAVLDFELLSPKWARELPGCSDELPPAWPSAELEVTDPLNNELRQDLELLYEGYAEACSKLVDARAARTSKIPAGGLIGFAYRSAENKRNAIARRQAVATKVRQEIRALKQAIERATATGTPPSRQLGGAIADLQRKVGEAKDLQQQLGVDILSDDTLDSIGLVLQSLAGQEIPKPENQSAEFHQALAILSQVPSLADNAAALAEQSRRPPVAHLVIELNRQLLLRSYYERLEANAERGLAYALQLAESVESQARAYRDFVNELCNFGFPNSGLQCDELTVDTMNDGCELPASTGSCPLAVTWAEVLDEEGEKERHALAAVVALSNAHRAAARATELEFRLNDLTYRRALLTSENAIAQWDNLIGVPVDQVAAFYEAGIKPEELGDFIVKALALAGIAVAVGKD